MALNFNARNAMLDFQPITNALYGYTQGVNDNIKRENWNALAGGGMPGVDPAMSQFIKAAGPDKGPDMYMRAYGNAQDRAHRDRQFTASRTDADRSHELQRQQFGISAASNARQAETHRLDIERRRAEARLPVVASILNNSDPASRADQWRQYIETDGDLVRKMPPPYRANPELGARWVYGQAGKAVETGQPKVMEVEPGKRLVRVDQSGRASEVYAAPPDGSKESTLSKEIDKARVDMAQKDIQAAQGANEVVSIVGQLRGVVTDKKLAGAIGPIRGSEAYQTGASYLPFNEGFGYANPETNAQIRRLQSQLELAGGEKMKGLGAQSDSDAKRLSAAVAGLTSARTAKEFNNALEIIEGSVKGAIARGQMATKEFPSLGGRLAPSNDAAQSRQEGKPQRETQILDGKPYVKIDGKWHEQ